MNGLPGGEKNLENMFSRSDTISEYDRQTDRKNCYNKFLIVLNCYSAIRLLDRKCELWNKTQSETEECK